MGNHRFRLSDMIPNSWLYKLKGMAKSSANHSSNLKRTEPQHPRKSHHFTRDLTLSNNSAPPSDFKHSDTRYFPIPNPNPPRRSAKHRRMSPRKPRKKKPPRLVSSSVSAGCSCRATLDSVWAKTESSASPCSDSDESSAEQQLPRSFDQMVSWSTSCSCRLDPGATDIVIDVARSEFTIPEVELPPFATKPMKFTDMVKNVRQQEEPRDRPLSVKVVKEQTGTVAGIKLSPVRGFVVNSPSVRLRKSRPSNSPRTSPRHRAHDSHRKSGVSALSGSSTGSGNRRRRSVSDSFAVVKSSADPKSDFRESMVEMIRENNIRASKDLEELLACYLSLNAAEYHDVIITVFKQIWFDISDIRLK